MCLFRVAFAESDPKVHGLRGGILITGCYNAALCVYESIPFATNVAKPGIDQPT